MELTVGVELPTVIDSVFESVFCGLLLSLTVTVKMNVPEAVGVPEMAPVEALIARPPGRPPPTDHGYGVVPPLTDTPCAYPVPMVAEGSEVVVIESPDAAAVTVTVTLPEHALVLP